MVYINLLYIDANLKPFKRILPKKKSLQWQKFSLKTKIPKYGIAIMLELQVDSQTPGVKMLIDDFTLKITDN